MFFWGGRLMNKKQNPVNKKKLRIIPVLLIAAVFGVIFTIGGFSFAASQESHDSFCASCHTQPESTYYQRSQGTSATDLASFHTTQKTACIDCHSGQGLTGRVTAELLGARNALKWYTGTAVQPAVLSYPIADGNCLKCHQDVTQQGFVQKEQITVPGRNGREGGRPNHYHEFLARWQASAPNAGTCISCHSGHSTAVTVQNGFLNDQAVQNTCDACHQVLRKEGG
jgi:nitrate/TMAO reductase-like tetraheme cytochrome c subunit